jgi:hypothetical protein
VSDEKEIQDAIEALIRAGIQYGWALGREGYTLPDPLFDWSTGVPLIVATLVEKDGAS